MQDYEGPPPYHPLIGEGAWPDHTVNMVTFLLLVAAGIVCYLAYRAGERAALRNHDTGRGKAPAIIYAEVRKKIDIALMATGERIFAPARTVMETMELYLAPVLALSAGVGGNYNALRKALTTTTKEVDAHHDGHGNVTVGGGGQPMILITPVAGAGGGGVSASSAAGAGTASASVSGPSGGLQVMQPTVLSLPGATPIAHGVSDHGHGPEKRKVELTSREQSRAVREALEALADYWQKDRVEGALKAAQTALLIQKPIGSGPLPPVLRTPRERPVRLARDETRPAEAPKPLTPPF